MLQHFKGRLRLFHGFFLQRPDGLLKGGLVAAAQPGQLLGVFLFQGRQQGAAEPADVRTKLLRLSEQHVEPVMRERRVERLQNRGDIDARRAGPDQQTGIDARRKQRQLAHLPGQVHAVPDLEEPVVHDVPVLEQRLVRRQAES